MSADKIAELGGGLCDCCAGGVGPCLKMTCCSICVYSQASENSGVGESCLFECILAYFIFCAIPYRMSQVNVKLGGPDDFTTRCLKMTCCGCCVGPCMICQFVRAVEKGNATGVLKPKNQGGAPQTEEMSF